MYNKCGAWLAGQRYTCTCATCVYTQGICVWGGTGGHSVRCGTRSSVGACDCSAGTASLMRVLSAASVLADMLEQSN